jgi:hypothetical protein
MRHVSDKTGRDLEELNAMIAWPLYKKYGHAHEAFKIAITDPDSVFGEFNLPEDVRSELQANVARRLTPQPVKVRADIELTCFAYAGVLAIQKALEAGGTLKTEAIPIDIRLIAPPLYVLISNATDKSGAIERLEMAIERIKEVIEENQGQCVVKLKVRARMGPEVIADFARSPRQYRRRTSWSSRRSWSGWQGKTRRCQVRAVSFSRSSEAELWDRRRGVRSGRLIRHAVEGQHCWTFATYLDDTKLSSPIQVKCQFECMHTYSCCAGSTEPAPRSRLHQPTRL